MGVATNSEGWLVYVPSTNNTLVSNDVWFDEKFQTTHVRLASRTRVQGGIPLQPHSQAITNDDQVEVVGTILPHDQGGENVDDGSSPLYFDVETPDGPVDDPLKTVNDNDSVLFEYEQFEDWVKDSDSEQNEDDHSQESAITSSSDSQSKVTWDDDLTQTTVYSPSVPAAESLNLRRSRRIMNMPPEQASLVLTVPPPNPTNVHKALA